jgi:hypothetical protein
MTALRLCVCIAATSLQLIAQDDAMAFLTDRYRRAAYILSALEQENRASMGHNNTSLVERTAKKLIAELEDAFNSRDALANIQAYMEVRRQTDGMLPTAQLY